MSLPDSGCSDQLEFRMRTELSPSLTHNGQVARMRNSSLLFEAIEIWGLSFTAAKPIPV